MTGFSVAVDLGNPGHLFACGGLLEAADLLWRDRAFVSGRFEGERFHIDAPGNLSQLVRWLREASVAGVVTTETQIKGSNAFRRVHAYGGEGADPAILVWPDQRLWKLDSWSGEDFGRTEIKTFAGQMKAPRVVAYLLDGLGVVDDFETDLFERALDEPEASPFGFDVRGGRAALDIGFSPDANGIPTVVRPALDLFAALGLQGFRPAQTKAELIFGIWRQPLPLELARAAAGCAFEPPGLRRFQFRLLGRKARSGVEGAPNDQYKAFTRTVEVRRNEGNTI